MKLREIYTNCNTILNKDGNDGYITMDRFNSLLPMVLTEFVRMKCEELFQITDSGRAIPKSAYSSKFIQKLITAYIIPNTNGVTSYGDVPTNFLYWLNGSMVINNASVKELELVTESEYLNRISNMLSKPIEENPISWIVGDKIYFLPVIDSVDIYSNVFYIRKPVTPFLDYYMDANADIVFMDTGTSVTIKGGTEYRDGTTTGTKTSQTVELEIPDDFHPEFTDLLIEKLSLSYDDQLKLQYSMSKQQKEDSR